LGFGFAGLATQGLLDCRQRCRLTQHASMHVLMGRGLVRSATLLHQQDREAQEILGVLPYFAC